MSQNFSSPEASPELPPVLELPETLQAASNGTAVAAAAKPRKPRRDREEEPDMRVSLSFGRGGRLVDEWRGSE